MCPDFENDYGICSYVAFMDSLIEYPEDVKVLRSKGILVNSLGSDEELVNFFKIISTDVVPNRETYYEVRCTIHEYYCNKCQTWIALSFHTYFSYDNVVFVMRLITMSISKIKECIFLCVVCLS